MDIFKQDGGTEVLKMCVLRVIFTVATNPASTATLLGRSVNALSRLDVQGTSKCRVNRRRKLDVQFSTYTGSFWARDSMAS